jgi:hypothetical protein
MDPDETLRLAVDAAREGRRAEFNEHKKNLIDWLKRGGFPPQPTTDPAKQALMMAIRMEVRS